ncbi:hypothetical protein M422DRAFT_51420 [Sphaerobolus stellatus SS14]|uniref:Uncharacterized protein n=1 Tax=Sphaerobolus stellatus (strain SS14) TaxID=990650 RepID=A0A0C9ULA0_SPHS4|nr:hypothetical protein M422DRAFT_51420 [Sphaerobolus stellatus SS14]
MAIPILNFIADHRYFSTTDKDAYSIIMDDRNILKLRKTIRGSTSSSSETIIRLRLPDHINALSYCCSRVDEESRPYVSIQLELRKPWDPVSFLPKDFPKGTSYILLELNVLPSKERLWDEFVEFIDRVSVVMGTSFMSSMRILIQKFPSVMITRPGVLTIKAEDIRRLAPGRRLNDTIMAIGLQ